eukprot:TRINITY_DN5521_c0_g1_i1.p1 TRINITY_DN5521_c0_g1~~TRINITY_DN5521_c0_g1_i1.p1  ORF type:complete len:362 (+),score=104.99 TRINITY_DN5521_c0_g1_i1:48-1133(+)
MDNNDKRPVVRVTVWIHGTSAKEVIKMIGLPTINHPFYRPFPGMIHIDDIVSELGETGHRFCVVAKALHGANAAKHPREHMYFFGWSGTLSEAARLQAGEELYEALVQLIEKYNNLPEKPRVKLTIMTHSHGGNVVLSMVRWDRMQKRIKRDLERQQQSHSDEESGEPDAQPLEQQQPQQHTQHRSLRRRASEPNPCRKRSKGAPLSAISPSQVCTLNRTNTTIHHNTTTPSNYNNNNNDDDDDNTNELDDSTPPTFVISKLVMLACPIMDEWKHHASHPMFARVYSLYSKSDYTQLLGSSGSVWLANRSFPDSSNLVQRDVDGVSLHISFSKHAFLSRLPGILAGLKQQQQQQQQQQAVA